jgi:transposase
MAYRHGNRYQQNMFPKSIEEYIPEDDKVRAYDAFVEMLDLKELGIEIEEGQVGNPDYDPRAMIKLLVYGYAYGIRSSRKLERATYHNVAFIWLMGGLQPDHKTIANFRKNNKGALKNILKQCARLCIKLGLIEGNTLFVDGSKIRANASIDNVWTQERCDKYLKKIDEHIETILKECDTIDETEQNSESFVKLSKELKNKEVLREKVCEIMKELKEQGLNSINTTDPDSNKVKGRQGTHAGYNSQIVVDEKHGLIVSSDVVSENNDRNQFAEQIKQAQDTLGHPCANACADAGYADTDELKKVVDQQVNVIVPSEEQASETNKEPFAKEQFKYDVERNFYTCPEGHKLLYQGFDKEKQVNVYGASKTVCQACKYFGVCTTSPHGRRIKRLVNEEIKKQLECNYHKKESQAIYKLRKEKTELPFGHIKRNLGVNALLLRGRDGAKAEFSILASCFNLARIITLLGVKPLIKAMNS